MNKLLCVLLAMSVAPPAFAGSKTVIFSLSDGETGTWVNAINAAGTVTGDYGPDSQRSTYIRHPDGSTETFVYQDYSTYPVAINDSGQVVGAVYNYQTFKQHGFLRQPDGTFTLIDYPGADVTGAVSINASGTILGAYRSDGKYHNYIRDPDGTFHVFKVPKWEFSSPVAIADNGAIVGWVNKRNQTHGFYRDPQGNYAVFDPPNVKNSTWPRAIAADGTIAGYYGTTGGRGYGFVRHPDGTIETFLPQGGLDTYVADINDRGVIVGDYYGADKKYHDFVRKPDGTIKSFSVKRRLGDSVGGPTVINSHGVIAGNFARPKDEQEFPLVFGFVKQP